MQFSLTPDHMFKSVTDITPALLMQDGISLLLLDLDNTLAPYKVMDLTEDVLSWTEELRACGITLYIVSNSKTQRPELFASRLGIGFCMKAHKPSTVSINRVISECGKDSNEAALVGDQIFTDVLGANRAGIMSILVYPIKFSNPFYRLRYFVELPFRHSKK